VEELADLAKWVIQLREAVLARWERQKCSAVLR